MTQAKLRAISLTQPWASLVAIGKKRYETRSWSTGYRGTIAIAAAKGFPRPCKDLCAKQPFAAALHAGGIYDASGCVAVTGCIVAVVELVACVRVDGGLPDDTSLPEPGDHELVFGDYSAGRFAWALTNLRRLERPVPAKGALGLWAVPEDVAHAVQEQIR